MARILIAGCGYVGSALAARLVEDSHQVWGLRRRPGVIAGGVERIEADLAVPGTLRDLPGGLDYVVYTAGPSGRDDALYRTAYVEGPMRLLEALERQAQNPRRMLFVSSTSVYGQSNGDWVDEGSPTEPEQHTGRRLLEGEEVLRSGPFPSTVVRFAGIYGPRRTRLLDRVRSGRAIYVPGAPRYTNRIHRDDCAGVLRHLLSQEEPLDLYIGVDDEPAPEDTVLSWVAGALGAPAPRPAWAEEVKELARSTNKRCRNQRLVESGYSFRYPTYREGYTELIRELS